ncbi:MAG: type 1 glutamine amidotransferase domain-containing protein [Cellvibrionaceae bacterium]
MSKKILIVVTNVDSLANEANGTYLPELTHALSVLLNHGYDYDIISPKGGKAPHYGGDDKGDEKTQILLQDAKFVESLNNTLTLNDIKAEDYSAVFYPGGYGLLFDLVEDQTIADISTTIYEAGGVISAVCHGPAALHSITLSDGSSILKGKQVTGFTREEEVAMNTLDKVPFLVEEKLLEKAASYSKVATWGVNVIQDGRVITGQNPSSAHAVGEALVKLMD